MKKKEYEGLKTRLEKYYIQIVINNKNLKTMNTAFKNSGTQ
jgi:hypothetical protein